MTFYKTWLIGDSGKDLDSTNEDETVRTRTCKVRINTLGFFGNLSTKRIDIHIRVNEHNRSYPHSCPILSGGSLNVLKSLILSAY